MLIDLAILLLLSLTGVFVAVPTALFGTRKGVELGLWLLVAPLWALVPILAGVRFPALWALSAALAAGLVAGAIQRAWRHDFRRNNPWYTANDGFVAYTMGETALLGLFVAGTAFLLTV